MRIYGRSLLDLVLDGFPEKDDLRFVLYPLIPSTEQKFKLTSSLGAYDRIAMPFRSTSGASGDDEVLIGNTQVLDCNLQDTRWSIESGD